MSFTKFFDVDWNNQVKLTIIYIFDPVRRQLKPVVLNMLQMKSAKISEPHLLRGQPDLKPGWIKSSLNNKLKMMQMKRWKGSYWQKIVKLQNDLMTL